jgi:hypothetical protein
VIRIITPVELKPGTAGAIPGSVMNNLLGNGSSGRLYKNLREQHGFTYGAYSQLRSDRLIGNFMASASVRNEKTDSAIGQFIYEFNRMRNEMVPAEDVSRTKNEMSGSFARSLENPATIANFALNVARYNLPKDYYQNYLRNLSAVDAATVKAMADRFIMPNNLNIIIVGNAKQIAPGLERYGEVRYYDVYGNPVAAPVTKSAAAGVTAESILKKSIEAQGGEAAINAIKDITVSGTAEVMGQKLTYKQVNIPGSGFLQSLGMGGMVIQSQVKRGNEYSLSARGQEVPVDDKMKEELDESTNVAAEPYILSHGYSFKLKGIESVDGKDANAVEVTSPKGRVITNYYDVASGLKVKESKSEEGAVSSVTIKEYRTVNGVKIPVKLLIEQGPVKINFEVTDVQANTGIKVADLK